MGTVRFSLVRALAAALAAVVLTSCGGSGARTGTPTAVTLLATDAPSALVLSATIDLSIELIERDGSAILVTPAPVTVEFAGLLGVVAVVGRPSIVLDAPTTFTAARITLSNVSVTVAPCPFFTVGGSPAAPPVTRTLPPATVTVRFEHAVTVTPGTPLGLLLDLDLARSIRVDDPVAGGVTFNPTFSVERVGGTDDEGELELEDEIDDLVGTVVSVDDTASPRSLVLRIGPSTTLTIVVDDETDVEDEAGNGLATLASLVGRVVEVEPVLRADGTIVAEEIEAVEAVTGIVTGVTPRTGGAASFDVLLRGSVPDLGFRFPGPVVTVPIPPSGTRFRIAGLEPVELPPGFAFDASHLAIGQRVTAAAGEFEADENELRAASLEMILKKEAVDGTIVSVGADGSFVLDVTSSLGCLLVGGTLDVVVEPATTLVPSAGSGALTLAAGAPVRVTGFVFRKPDAAADATQVVMLATKVKALTTAGARP